ncbi:DUF4304 domain-containing protein [Klebsiella aerogenes]|uniref:DUF4304 domain-containing protein n=1 Tax=Klebsiella aerogenes TaxID=548 RepID=UPI002279D017|nr:DUF4304 domain-containing protein [Klebsiella aerogenes]MCY4764105.1 DUF4304 domain-containing protein [Klebsiella aerogenes]
MDDKSIVSNINPIIKRYGFKRKGHGWKRTKGSVTVILALQKSRYSNSFTFEMGICVDELRDVDALKYYTCGISLRLNSIPEFEPVDIDKSLDLEINNENYFYSFVEFLDEKGMDVIMSFFEPEYLQRLYKEGFFIDKMIDNHSVDILSN